MSVESDYEETKKKLLAMLPEGETETDIIVSEEEQSGISVDNVLVKITNDEEKDEPLSEEELKEQNQGYKLTEEEIIEVKQEELKRIIQWPRNKGRKELAAYLNGDSLSARQILLAVCYQCMAGFCDGASDCFVYTCAAHDFMFYQEGGPKKRRGVDKSEQESEECIIKNEE
jgi:hypothetical protein